MAGDVQTQGGGVALNQPNKLSPANPRNDARGHVAKTRNSIPDPGFAICIPAIHLSLKTGRLENPAIRPQRLAVYPGAIGAGEERHHGGDIFRLAEAFER